MLKRREFTQLLTATSLLPYSVNVFSSLLTDKDALIQNPVHFIYEKKARSYGLKEQVSFADFEKVHCISGDITELWYNDLHKLWQEKTILTAGLTRESEFFLLKTLARDYDYDVKYERPSHNFQLVSWLLGSADLST